MPIDLSTYMSEGDANSTYQNVAPPMAEPTCHLRAVNSTCNTDQKNMLASNAGVIINGVLYNEAADWQAPDPGITTVAGSPGVPPASIITSAPLPDTASMVPTSQNYSLPWPGLNQTGTYTVGNTTYHIGTLSATRSPASTQHTHTTTTSATRRPNSPSSSLPTGVYTATNIPPTSSISRSASASTAQSNDASSSVALGGTVFSSLSTFKPATVALAYVYLLGILSHGFVL